MAPVKITPKPAARLLELKIRINVELPLRRSAGMANKQIINPVTTQPIPFFINNKHSISL